MTPEHRDNIIAANQRRGSQFCKKCSAASVEIRDGAAVGGLPGIKYRQCGACGWTQAITHRPRRAKLTSGGEP